MDVLVFEQVGTLKELEFFGESALLGGLKDLTRNATITVESDYVQVLGRRKTCSTVTCTVSTASTAAVYSHQTSLLSLFFHSQLPSRSMRCLQCCQGCVLNLWWKKVLLRKTWHPRWRRKMKKEWNRTALWQDRRLCCRCHRRHHRNRWNRKNNKTN